MKISLKKLAVMAVMPALIFSVMNFAGPLTAKGQVQQSCDTLTLVSGTGTDTAGYTETDPGSGAAALNATSYSGGSFSAATETDTVIPPWLDPATDATFASSGAAWISTDASWPGGEGNEEGSATSSQWRLFQDTFSLPAGATVSSSEVSFAADNAVEVYLNGASIGSTGNVFGDVSDTSAQNFASASTASFTPVADEQNTLSFVVRNWQGDTATNPTGLVYKATVNYCVPGAEANTAKVHVLKYLDGAVATASSSDSYQFPMTWTYRADNQNEGATTTDEFVLGNSEGGATNAYGADSVELQTPASLTLSEVTTGTSTQVLPVGASCEDGKYRLEGYRVSNTSFDAAASAELQTTAPNFNNLTQDAYVIVSNKSCGSDALHVDNITMERSSGVADGTFENGWKYVFTVTTPNDEPNLAMKFTDWLMQGDSSKKIPVANNMRISSPQANNGGATVTLTGSDTYSSPSLVMTGDMDPNMVGRQVQVVVEVRIPAGTDNGNYTTIYTIQTQPNQST